GTSVGIGGTVGAILFGLIAAAAGVAIVAKAPRRVFGVLVGVAIVALVLAFLCWQISPAPEGRNIMPLGDVLRSTVLLALPPILGSLAGVLCERSGVINVAIEGQFVMGAFAAALGATVAGTVWAGLIAAAIGGLIIAAMLAILSIRYLVDQVVLGIVLNVFAL